MMKSTAASTTSTLADNAVSMVDTAAQAADQAIRSSQRVASQALEQIAEQVDGAREQASAALGRITSDAQGLSRRGLQAVRDGSQQIRQQALHASESTAAYVKEEPFKSILIAAAVGATLMALVGLLNRSSSRRH